MGWPNMYFALRKQPGQKFNNFGEFYIVQKRRLVDFKAVELFGPEAQTPEAVKRSPGDMENGRRTTTSSFSTYFSPTLD